jgi:RHS repeat-associated protein
MGADISLPMFNDFGGSGNVEVFFTKLGKANSIALTTAGTSLLRSADDGKGTQIVFTYARGPIAPGQGRRNPVIARVTATSTGNGTVIKDYGYQSPRIHSTGKFFIGYDQVSSADPFVSEVDAFLNDDRYSGVFLSSRTHDTRTPAVDKFEYRLYGDALFQGIPWKRLTEQGGGWQGTSVPAPPTLAEKTQFLTYEAEVCPATSMITKAAGTLNVTTQHEFPPAFAKHLSCLVQRTVQSGAHADPALDFRHETLLTRNALGQVTQVQALALAGALTLQTIGYNADSTVDRILTPGRGTTVFGYDPIRRLLNQVTTADGVITTVTGRGAATDLIQSLTAERGAGPFSQNFSYDGQERLQKRWNNLGAATALNPNEIISYRFATSLQPAMTSISTLVDGVAGIASNGVEYATAAGEPVATAHRVPEGWSFGNVQRRLKAAGETQIQLRPNLLPADDPLAMTYDGFFVGASLINDAVSSAFGSPVSSATSFHVDVQRRTAVTLDLSGGALRQTTVENGLLSTAAILDSAKRVVSFQDEAQGVYGYAYDALGRLRRVTLPDGKVHRAIYDDYGRVRRVERDGIGAVDTVFDPTTGFPTSKSFSSPAGVPFRRISWTYDSIGRESVALHADLTGTATQTFRSFYDGQTPTAIAPLNAKGLLTAVAGDGYVKTFEYRLDGLLRKRAVSLTGWRTIASEYIYLDDGSVARRITTVLDAAGAVLSSAIYDTDRDAAGRLSAERLNGLPLATFNYDSLGRPSSAVFAGGGSATLGYDGFTRGLVAISQQATAFSSSSSLRWNARGLVDSESIAVGALSLARQHGYSPQGFLTNSADPQSSYVYSYDAIGLPTAIQTGATIRSFTQVGDVLTVGTTQYQFDGVGRTIRRDDLSFLYGPNGQIASANRGLSEWRFLYDEQDRRLVKLSGGAPVAAFLDEGYLDPSGLTEVVQFGGRPVGLVRGGAFQLIGSDPRGSAIADVTGAALVPSPFGSRTARPSFAAALDYVEKGYDADLGVVRMGVRDYDPEIDRFLTPDPLFLEKPELCLKSPVECNLYGYARSNPLKFVDPTGQEGQTWGDWARNKEQWIDSLSFLKPMCSNCNAHSVMGEPAAILKGSLDFLHVGEGLAAAISDPTLSPTQRAMQAGADVLRVIQIATVVGVVFGSVSSALSSAAQTTGQGFRSFSAFKQALGPAGPGQQWHHIVEQTPGNVARFGGEAIHNTGNLVRLGTAFHRQVSGLYSSIRPDITGSTSLTVRQWLSTQSFQAQGAFGQRVLQNISNGVWP